jgi:hypothetical protein
MRGPDGTPAGLTCRSPDRPALADTGGRVTMPFLPTLVTVVLLATASVFCPNGQSNTTGPAARMIPASGGASLAMAEPATPAAEPAPRAPAVVAFSEVYPLTAIPADPATTSALPAPPPVHAAAAAPAPAPAMRSPRRLAVTGRRPCVGKRCPDTNPFAAARQGAEEPATAEAAAPPSPVPAALPFTDRVAEVVAPVAREVKTRVSELTGTAGDLVRGGQSVVSGSAMVLADRLF